MERTAKIEKLRGLLEPAVESQGAFLVDLSLKGEGKRQLLEVFCDTESGITINDCAEISRQVLPIIEASGILSESFRLDVSSPGVGVPLKDRRQYKSNIGRGMSVKYLDAGVTKEADGDLAGLTDDRITLKTETASIELGFDSIVEARVKIRW
jgi:ribosome maturation factor RimP